MLSTWMLMYFSKFLAFPVIWEKIFVLMFLFTIILNSMQCWIEVNGADMI